jgi:hypothetical protein
MLKMIDKKNELLNIKELRNIKHKLITNKEFTQREKKVIKIIKKIFQS